MQTQCSICVDRKRRPSIDAMLQGGGLVRDVAARFGLAKSSVHRHSQKHLGLVRTSPGPRPKAAIQAVAAVVPEAVAEPVRAVEPVALRSPDDVLGALEWSVAETKDLLARAKVAGDLRLQNQLLVTAIGALDKLAKSVGLYNDGTVVNVNPIEQKVVNVLAGMTTDELRAYVRSATSAKELAGD